jgi:heme A synthase
VQANNVLARFARYCAACPAGATAAQKQLFFRQALLGMLMEVSTGSSGDVAAHTTAATLTSSLALYENKALQRERAEDLAGSNNALYSGATLLLLALGQGSTTKTF